MIFNRQIREEEEGVDRKNNAVANKKLEYGVKWNSPVPAVDETLVKKNSDRVTPSEAIGRMAQPATRVDSKKSNRSWKRVFYLLYPPLDKNTQYQYGKLVYIRVVGGGARPSRRSCPGRRCDRSGVRRKEKDGSKVTAERVQLSQPRDINWEGGRERERKRREEEDRDGWKRERSESKKEERVEVIVTIRRSTEEYKTPTVQLGEVSAFVTAWL